MVSAISRTLWLGTALLTFVMVGALSIASNASATTTPPQPAAVAANQAAEPAQPAGDVADFQTPPRTVNPATDLTERLSTAHLDIYYTTDAATFPDDATTVPIVTILALDLELTYSILVTNYGFRPPTGLNGGKLRVNVASFGSGDAALGRYYPVTKELQVHPSVLRRSLTFPPRAGAAFHEFIHAVQFEYNPGIGWFGEPWFIEGTARLIEDHLFADVDELCNPSAFEFAPFCSSMIQFLQAPEQLGFYNNGTPRAGLLETEYEAALFWKYFSERAGNAPLSEPGYKINAMRTLFEVAFGNATSTRAVDDALAALGKSMTFEDLYRDFILANFTKDYTYQSKYAYVDDDTRPYPAPFVTRTVTLNQNTSLTTPLEYMQPWGARYYVGNIGQNCQYVDVIANDELGSTSVFHVIAISGTQVVDVATTVSGDFRRLYFAGGGSGLTRIAVVVGSEEAGARYELSMRCVNASLSVVSPSSAVPAYAGLPSLPDKFLIYTVVTAENQVAFGLNSSAFRVEVGNKNAQIVSVANVQDQYWLVVQAPTQADSTFYPLTVRIDGGASQTINDAVLYQPRPRVDQVLVLDNSGSMADEGKLLAVQNAANLFVNVTAPLDKIGVVTFSNSARTALTLTQASGFVKGAAEFVIDHMVAEGQTCIGCGAAEAQAQIDAAGVTTHTPTVILLSDGMENRFPLWDNVKQNLIDNGTVVNTVFVGPANAEAEALMQQIADESNGGTYTRVFLNSELGGSNVARVGGFHTGPIEITSLKNRTANLFKEIREDAEYHDRFYIAAGLQSGPVTVTKLITVEPGLREAVFVGNSNLDLFGVTLYRPDNTVVSAEPDILDVASSPNHKTFRMLLPMSGTWRMELLLALDAEYLVVGSGRSYTNLYGAIGLTPQERQPGRPVPILAILADTAPITGATVGVLVQAPDSSFNQTLTLFDDGRHGDGAANDGVYGNSYRQTRLGGSYRATIEAFGTNNAGHQFTRYKGLSFYLNAPVDTDNDGLPDWWETWAKYPPTVNGGEANLDPDDDGLTNYQEFLLLTDPYDHDTDGGGESDGSEAAGGSNPHDPSDDGIRPPRSFLVRPGNGQAVASAEPPPVGGALSLQRRVVSGSTPALARTASSQGWVTVTSSLSGTGAFTDTGVLNGVTYEYRAIAVSAAGDRSRPSRVVTIQPQASLGPPPGGWKLYLPAGRR